MCLCACSDFRLYSITKAWNLKALFPHSTFHQPCSQNQLKHKLRAASASHSVSGQVCTRCNLHMNCMCSLYTRLFILCRWWPKLMFTAHRWRLSQCVCTGSQLLAKHPAYKDGLCILVFDILPTCCISPPLFLSQSCPVGCQFLLLMAALLARTSL